MSRGKQETQVLIAGIKDQLNRLVTQLEDLEEMKGELDEAEYREARQETIGQMREFEATLKKTVAGDMTLVSELGSIQLAIQAAVSNAFKTPEVIKLFAKREPGQLRTRLTRLQRERKLGHLSEEVYNSQAVEILTALKKLGDKLTPDEDAFLAQHADAALAEFEKVEGMGIGSGGQAAVLKAASGQIKRASNQ